MTPPARGETPYGGRRFGCLLASPHVLLILAILFWASNAVVGRALVAAVPPVTLSFWRWIVALAILLPFAWRDLRAGLATVRRHWPMIAVLGLFCVTGSQTLFYVGLTDTPAVNASTVATMGPVVIPAVAWLIYRTRWSGREAISLVLALLGVWVVIFKGDLGLTRELRFNHGDLVVLLAVCGWSIYTVLLTRPPPGLPGAALLAAVIAFGLFFMVPFLIWEVAAGATATFGPARVGAILYLGTFPGVIAILFWNRAVVEVGANTAGVFMYLTPMFSAVLAVVFLGEAVRFYHLIGIALIFAGIRVAAGVGRTRGATAPAGDRNRW